MATPTGLLLVIAASAAFALATPSAQARDAAAPPTEEFKAMDGNNDGVVSSSESEEYARKMFDLIDTDGDDKISAAEIDASAGIVTGQAAGSAALNAAQKIRRRDINQDGEISQGEYADAAASRFQQLDSNSNGELSQQELDAGG